MRPLTREMKIKMRVISVFLFLSVFSTGALAGNLSCPFLQPIVQAMLNQHIIFNKFTSNIEHRTIDQYIKSLDGSKLYLQKKDIDSIKSELRGVQAKLEKRDCESLHRVHKIFLKRVEERVKFAKKYLGDEYKFDKSVEIRLDADEREYASNSKEADQFQSKYIHFQIANFLASEMEIKEAKKLVLKRYDRALKRLKEQKTEDLYANFLDSIAHALDPHSSFLSKERLEEFEIQMRLSLEGIGATLSSQDGYTVIEQLIKGGAAEASNVLMSQDKIIAVGQGASGEYVPIIDMPLNEVVRMIRGPKGTKVRLKILRKAADKTERFEVTLVRRKINLEEEAAKIRYVKRKMDGEEKTIGVLELPSFYLDTRKGGRSCYEDVKKLLKEANKKKVDGIVFDLSSNGGGSLDDAVRLAGLFFKTGNVVKTRGVIQSERSSGGSSFEKLADKDPSVDYTGPLVILTSRFSASASEIVAGALQDYDRAVVVGGDHTFGKGTVQSIMPLPRDLGAFKVTMGMFYIPGGKSTQHGGVTADIPFPSVYDNEDIGEKTLDYSLPPRSIRDFLSSDAYVTEGEDAWAKVDSKTVKELSRRSKKRIAESKKFKEILEDIKKNKSKDKTIKLSEVLAEKVEKQAEEEKNKKKRNNMALREKEYLERADIDEAISVALDLIQLQEASNVVADKNKSNSDS